MSIFGGSMISIWCRISVKDTRFPEKSSTLFQREHKLWLYENIADWYLHLSAHMILYFIDLSGVYLFVCFQLAELNINRLNNVHEYKF